MSDERLAPDTRSRWREWRFIPEQSDTAIHRPRKYLKFILLTCKLMISGGCLWFTLDRINFSEGFIPRVSTFDYRWSFLAVLFVAAQIPLLALRLQAIMKVLAPHPSSLTVAAAGAVTSICSFFAQAVPGVVSEAIRAWLLVRHGYNWRDGVNGVLIDRCVGVSVLFIFSFAILLFPSPLTSFMGYRDLVLLIYGVSIAITLLTIVFAPYVFALFGNYKLLSWLATFIKELRRVLLGPKSPRIFSLACLVHILNVLVIWAAGRMLGLSFSATDCGVLFVVIVGILILPISINGWGLRELVVVQLLSAHGFASGQALLFSLYLGLIFVVVGLLGAVVWLLYPLPQIRYSKGT